LQAIPILNDALSALDTIKEADITYIKKLTNPPSAIKTVLQAVCVVLDIKPAKVCGRPTQAQQQAFADASALSSLCLQDGMTDRMPTPLQGPGAPDQLSGCTMHCVGPGVHAVRGALFDCAAGKGRSRRTA
jgi:hypothetical protein